MRFPILLVLIIGFIFSATCFATYTTISGNVIYSHNTSVVENANVTILQAFQCDESNAYLNSTLTNATGGFTLGFDDTASFSFKLVIRKFNGTSNPNHIEYISRDFPSLPYFELSNIFSTLSAQNLSIGLVPATALYVNATNLTGDLTNFGYFVKEKVYRDMKGCSQNATNATFYLEQTREYVLEMFQDYNITGNDEPGAFPRGYLISVLLCCITQRRKMATATHLFSPIVFQFT